MPAAAVIPAPIAYINTVAVKTLVVGFRSVWFLWPDVMLRPGAYLLVFECTPPSLTVWGVGLRIVYFKKIRVFKAGVTLAF